MKTYTKTITTTQPRLVIEYDHDVESPRTWSNLGYFFTQETRNISPDGRDHVIYDIMVQTGNEASDTQDHINLMKKRINKETSEKVKAIYPVYKYEHGNVVYRRGTAQGFDYSNCGFYIVTDKTQAIMGTPKKFFEKVIDAELETYTAWANGDAYGFMLYDENGELEDSCWGFYNLEEIQEYLPEDFKNEDLSEYLKY